MSSSATDMKAPLLTADLKSSDVVVLIDEKTPALTPLEQHIKKLRSSARAIQLIENAEALEVKRADGRERNGRVVSVLAVGGLGVGVRKAIFTALTKGNTHESYQDSYNNLVGPKGEKCPQPIPCCDCDSGGGESMAPIIQSMSGLTDIASQCDDLSSSFCGTYSDYSGYLALASFTIMAGLLLLLLVKYMRTTTCIREEAIRMSDLPEDEKTELTNYHLVVEIPGALLTAPLADLRASFFSRHSEFKNDAIYKKFFESKRTVAGFKSLGKNMKEIKKEDYKPIHRLFSKDGKYDLTKHILSYIELLPESKIKMLKRS